MHRICEKLSALALFLRSRSFAVGFLAIMMALSIYAMSAMVKAVYIVDGGQVTLTYTTETDTDKILDQEGILVEDHDLVRATSMEGGNCMELNITRAFPVSITADGKTQEMLVTGGTVDGLLMEAGIPLDSDDLLNRNLAQALSPQDKIVIQRVDYNEVTETQPIPHQVEEKSTSLIRRGTTRTLQTGTDGERHLTYSELIIDGVPQERKLLGEDVVRQPTAELVLVGDGSPISELDYSAQYPLGPDGVPLNYSEVLTNQSATGYSARAGARGASGRRCHPGTVAINYEEIPYGTKMYIASADGSFVYGYAIANDTGTGLMADIVDVDLFYDTYAESVLNSLRTVDIYILE